MTTADDLHAKHRMLCLSAWKEYETVCTTAPAEYKRVCKEAYDAANASTENKKDDTT